MSGEDPLRERGALLCRVPLPGRCAALARAEYDRDGTARRVPGDECGHPAPRLHTCACEPEPRDVLQPRAALPAPAARSFGRSMLLRSPWPAPPSRRDGRTRRSTVRVRTELGRCLSRTPSRRIGSEVRKPRLALRRRDSHACDRPCDCGCLCESSNWPSPNPANDVRRSPRAGGVGEGAADGPPDRATAASILRADAPHIRVPSCARLSQRNRFQLAPVPQSAQAPACARATLERRRPAELPCARAWVC